MLLEESLTRLYLKNLEIESFKNKKYEEIQKDKHVYIFSCDKPNIYKIGKSKDTLARKKQLQTANVDNIIILHDRPTSNDYLLELIVHYILNSYRCKSNGEHFTANLDYMKTVIDIAEVFLDTLKSTYEYITKDELLQKINENILNQSNIIPNNEIKKIIELVITQLITDNNIQLITDNNIQPIIDNNKSVIINNTIVKQHIDNVKLFLENYCIITSNRLDQIKTSEIYNYYLNKNYEKISIIKFIDYMKLNNIEIISKKGYKYFINIKIIDYIPNDPVSEWLCSYYDLTDNDKDRISSSDLYNSYIYDGNLKISIVKFSEYMKYNEIEFI